MKTYILSFLMLYAFFGFSQQSILYENIKQLENTGAEFEKVSDVFFGINATSLNDLHVKNFSTMENVRYLNYSPKILDSESKNISIEVPISGQAMQLQLTEVSASFYDYNLVNAEGKPVQKNTNVRHFRGIVRDQPNSLVAISFFEDDVAGLIATKDGNFNISKVEKTQQYIFFKDADLSLPLDFECSTNDESVKGYKMENINTSTTSSTPGTKCVQFYFETEYDIFTSKGSSIANVENYVTALCNQVSTIYQNEGITTEISEIKVWDTPDPYTGTNAGTLLTEFRDQTATFNGDLGMLLTSRSVGGGIAYVSTLCYSDPSYRVSVSGNLNSTVTNFPTYSWNTMVITHEFGHAFGSSHIHACVWNSNNTAIDGCYTPEGSCAQPGIPSAGGTIMSYCHLQSVGINFSLGFGPQPGDVIRSSVNNATCLSSCGNNNCPENLTITSIISNGSHETHEAENAITATNTIENGATAVYDAGYKITLSPGFKAIYGSNFRAFIDGCSTSTSQTLLADNTYPPELGNIETDAIPYAPKGIELNVYPVPVKGEATIAFNLQRETHVTVKLHDITGGLVKQIAENTHYKKGKHNLTLDASTLKAGIYIVVFTTSDGERISKHIAVE